MRRGGRSRTRRAAIGNPSPIELVDRIREACAEVAARARRVRIVDEAIPAYAEALARARPAAAEPPAMSESGAIDEEEAELRAAHLLQLDAINFGSGWFPTLRKPEGRSGFRTVEAGLRRRGPWTAAELVAVDAAEVAAALGQDPDHELIGLFAEHLRELGERVLDEHGGSFGELARSGSGSAVALAAQLAEWPGWRDLSSYDGRPVPFYKRAQIAAFDLHAAGIAPAEDIGRLTMFADNLVPHVLRLDRVLDFDRELVARIDRGEQIAHGSPEEVEIRACAVHAVERLVAAGGARDAASLDNLLWHRGAGRRYKAVPRHRARCTAY